MIGRPLAKSFVFLNQRIITPIKHYFIPKQFTFITLPQQQKHEFISVPHEQWPVNKAENEQQGKIKLLCLFLIAFFLGDWIYTFKFNQNVMYFYYVNFPLAMKMMEFWLAQTQKLFGPFVDLIPKQKYEILLLWNRLANIVLNTEKKTKLKDENVQILKKQLEEIDKKLE